jgi:hypothetical protein
VAAPRDVRAFGVAAFVDLVFARPFDLDAAFGCVFGFARPFFAARARRARVDFVFAMSAR